MHKADSSVSLPLVYLELLQHEQDDQVSADHRMSQCGPRGAREVQFGLFIPGAGDSDITRPTSSTSSNDRC